MSKHNSCITVLPTYSEALTARELLAKTKIHNEQIIVLGKALDENASDDYINNLLNVIGVPEDTIDCYLCLLHGDAFLLVTRGTYQEVERAYQTLRESGISSSVHFSM